ncbi:MAG: DnaD domain protein [Chloroflexi bacterium]|nr:DnaD domain protein [Chloroflexota bacterium]
MQGFSGFPGGKVRFTSVPDLFFSELLPSIDDLAELKVTLHIIWLLNRRRGYPRCVQLRELLSDGTLLRGLSGLDESPEKSLQKALERATTRGTLLHIMTRDGETEAHYYFLNTEQGRKTVEKIECGEIALGGPATVCGPRLTAEKPNIFVLYEQNIGLLQPMIAEELREAERDYPADWIADAFRIAAENNVRNWRYVRAILERWATEGKKELRSEENGRRYIEGKYADYIKH